MNIPEVQRISTEEKESLEGVFEEEEVLAGFKMCVADKAVGPDGLIMAFFQAFWKTSKGELM